MNRGHAQRVEVERLKRRMKDLLVRADLAEIVDGGIDLPLWTKVLRPALERRVAHVRDNLLTIDPAQFPVEQAVAAEFQKILDHVEALRGKTRDYRVEAERILRLIETAEASGIVPRSEPREEVHAEV